MKKEIKLGCPMEYEVDNIIHNGLFLRENEVNIVFKELEKSNKQKEVLDKIRKNNIRIIDYGFDYDGFNKEEDLKKLIDMLVDYAKQNDKLLEELK